MRRRILISAVIAIGVLAFMTGMALAQGGAEDKPEGEKSVKYFEWFIKKGGPIGWLLIVVDIASWAVIIEHFISIRRMTLLPEVAKSQIGELMEVKQFREVIEYTGAEPSYLSYLIHQALSEAGHGYAAMERAMEEAADERSSKLLRKIEMLNVIGNVAPMLGLLGTVYGMIMVFSKIVEADDMPPPAVLAGGVGIALVTTFWGLVVAIPALAVYAIMRNRIDALSSEAITLAQESISAFRPAPKKG